MQVLGPLHTALSANLGDRTAAWLYDELTSACVAVPGIGHLEDPELAADLQVARDFDRGMTGPPLSISMDFIAGGLVDMVAGLAQACVLFGFAWWAPPVLAGAWLGTHWLLRESAVWKDRNTEEVRQAQRDADYAYRLAVDPPAAKELRIFGLPDWVLERFLHQPAAAAPAAVRGHQDAGALGARQPGAGPGRQRAGAVDARGRRARSPSRPRRAGGVRLGGGRHVHDRVRRAELGAGRRRGAGSGRGQAQGGDGPGPARSRRDTGRPTACQRTRSGSGTSRSPTRPRRPARCCDGLDLEIPAGSSLAIVGQNGAGKTTLAKLLCRLYDPQSGAIEVDGADLQDLDLDSWRRRVTAVFQDFVRFELTLRENVAPQRDRRRGRRRCAGRGRRRRARARPGRARWPAWTRSSPRATPAAPTCPAGSGSGSPWPGRCRRYGSAPGSSCSTSRRRSSTSGARRRSSSGSSRPPDPARRSSSRTGSRPYGTPTGSRSSRTGRSPNSAATTN